VGRNNACLRNAIVLDPAVRVATLPYTKAATPRAPGKSDKSAPLTPRTSARLQASKNPIFFFRFSIISPATTFFFAVQIEFI
jgi:hypothetical protein